MADLTFNINAHRSANKALTEQVAELRKERDDFVKDAGYTLDCYTSAVMTKTAVQQGVREMAREIIQQAIKLRKDGK